MAHILLVEPDRSLAQTMQKYIAGSAHEVVQAHNAQQAIRQADKARPDLVILELAIPEHNGLAFLQEFRTYTDWSEIPVVIYSHIPLEDTGLTEKDWQKQGVAAYLYKSTKKLANVSNIIDQILNNYETT